MARERKIDMAPFRIPSESLTLKQALRAGVAYSLLWWGPQRSGCTQVDDQHLPIT